MYQLQLKGDVKSMNSLIGIMTNQDLVSKIMLGWLTIWSIKAVLIIGLLVIGYHVVKNKCPLH